MNSIILCEGFDDVFIVGYYLFKTQKWVYDKSGKISQFYDFPKVNFRNQLIEVYKKEGDSLAIWCVGGKDSFDSAFKFIKNINAQHPEEGIQKLFLLTDRDTSGIEECLKVIEEKMQNNGMRVDSLQNNYVSRFEYEVEGEKYPFFVIPMIIPFHEGGALETILIEAIEEMGDEERYIVAQAKKYIDDCVHSGKLNSYLQHSRLILKAKFSAVISVTNPDRSTALFNALLMSCPWEETETLKEHFRSFDELL